MVTAGIISVVIGDHFGGGDHFDGGDHFGGGTGCPTFLALMVILGSLYSFYSLKEYIYIFSNRVNYCRVQIKVVVLLLLQYTGAKPDLH